MKRNVLILLGLGILLVNFTSACKQKSNTSLDPIYNYTKSMVDDSAMVVTAHPIASQAGYEILRSGGNAVDAAIAVQFSLAVCYPIAGNIGGGGFMIYRSQDGEMHALDYREMAPLAATSNMYLDGEGNAIPENSRFGALAVGVPGTTAGMYEAFTKFSKLKDWGRLVAPAIKTARDGFRLTHRQARLLNKSKKDFDRYNSDPIVFNAKVWKGGDLFVQPELATTLESIAKEGPDGFYEGVVADQIVRQMEKSGGIITHEDLKNYRTVWRDPISFDYRGYKITSMPPPSSGGIALAQIMKMIEKYDLSDMDFQSAQHIHLIAEAERRAYADRATHLGDPDFHSVPIANLLDSMYLVNRMRDFDPNKASISDSTIAGIFKESPQTTHYSIVDYEGNAVSITSTLNGAYGSKLVVAEAGFLLNNEMDDFSAKPGVPNMYGLIGAEANKIEPQKRMLSSMTPTIVEKDGELFLVCGTPGGSTIITSVFQTISNTIDFEMSAKDAVQSPRFHHQWLPDRIDLEKDAISEEIINQLEAMGHTIRIRGKIGKVEAVKVLENGDLEGAADIRADDDVKGF